MKEKLFLSFMILSVFVLGVYAWFPSVSIPEEIDFDLVASNTKLGFTFTINNCTYSEIEITNYHTGCPCNSLHVKDDKGNLVSLRGWRIKPRTQQTVYAYFTIIPEAGQTFYRKTMIIATNHSTWPRLASVVTVKRVKGIVEVRPDALTNINAAIDQPSDQTITLYNASDSKCLIKNIQSSGPVIIEYSDFQLPFEILPSQAKELKFKMKPLKSGLLEGKLSLYCQHDIISVPYAIRVRGLTHLSDSVLFFPSKQSDNSSKVILHAHSAIDIESVSNEKLEDNRFTMQWKRVNACTFEATVILFEQYQQIPFSLGVTVSIQTKKGIEKHSLRIRNMPEMDVNGK